MTTFYLGDAIAGADDRTRLVTTSQKYRNAPRVICGEFIQRYRAIYVLQDRGMYLLR